MLAILPPSIQNKGRPQPAALASISNFTRFIICRPNQYGPSRRKISGGTLLVYLLATGNDALLPYPKIGRYLRGKARNPLANSPHLPKIFKKMVRKEDFWF